MKHTMICTRDDVGQVIDNLNESGAEWVRAKQIDAAIEHWNRRDKNVE